MCFFHCSLIKNVFQFADKKKDKSKIIVVTTVILGIIIITISTFLLWSWIGKDRGNMFIFTGSV